MRRVDLDSWTITPGARYFLHLASTPDSRHQSGVLPSVALIVASVSTGVVPCRGFDSDPLDNYKGEILRDAEKNPIAGATVRYWVMAESQGRQLAGETRTDGKGQHVLALPPGTYAYEYLLPLDGSLAARLEDIPELRWVEVGRGHTVTWEDASVTEGLDTLGDAPPSAKRDIAFVTEELLCDWHSEDGRPWQWIDVEEVTKEVWSRLQRARVPLRNVTLSAGGLAFPRPDLVPAFKRAGIPAEDLKYSQARLAVCFRNLRSLIQSGYVRMLPDERAKFAVLRTELQRNNITAPGSVPLYLSEARCVCLTRAAEIAGQNASARLNVFNPRERTQGLRFGALARMGFPGAGTPVDNIPPAGKK